MLAIEVEYLTGVAYAADDSGEGPDWPPQPDRLFSALVASWAARGERPEEREALEWLEQQDPPKIVSRGAECRTIAKAYVPPNDDSRSLAALPTHRKRQERRFPASVPHVPLVQFAWSAHPDEPMARALDALARDTSYLGHSASLVRCQAKLVDEIGDGQDAKRAPYPKRLSHLERAFKAKERPQPGEVVVAGVAPALDTQDSWFGREWIVFSNAGGTAPAPNAAAVVTKTLIKAIQSGYGDNDVPPWVSGHTPGGTPLKSAHLAVVPLMDAGWTWSQGRMMGLALILPRELEAASTRARDPTADHVDPEDEGASLEERGLFQALARLNAGGTGELALSLRLPGGLTWTVVREADPSRASLKPWRYLRPARRWATVTPIALDRHPKARSDVEEVIARSCPLIGLPGPSTVLASPYSAVSGAPSVGGERNGPSWTHWKRPGALASRRLTHAVITFTEPVKGPVILGAGRFMGMGLCLPIDDGSQR